MSKYNSFGSVIDTRSFTYGVDLAPDQTSSYNWSDYFGVYAKGGYGNSAFTSGLTGAVDNNNQLFEVAYLNPTTDATGVRRSLKDPDQLRNWERVEYLDTTVKTVPLPASLPLFSTALAALGFLLRRKASAG